MHTLDLPDGRTLRFDRPRIMGILNVTPDSFSDGGQWLDPTDAVRHGLEMARQGADVVDIGGESTRPGATRIDANEQIRRITPVIERLRPALDRDYPDVAISIDTTLVPVAQAALDVGAAIINDVSAGTEDPAIFGLAAQRGAPIILMHMLGLPADAHGEPQYDNVVEDVKTFLVHRAQVAADAQVPRHQIMIDPGIGFGKNGEQSLAQLANLKSLTRTGYPVLLGASRKRFIKAICHQRDRTTNDEVPPDQRLGATCAATALAVAAGVAMLRVHDVYANRQAADVAWAITRQRGFDSSAL